ncbi:MAG: hypothetical protein P8X90_25605, partial [Desulfobacterales bacterium]
MKEKKNLVSTLSVVLLIIIFCATGTQADQTDKLIKILIKKGIITSEEAKSLEKEVKGEVPEKEVEKEASTAEDWTKKVEVGYRKGAYIKTPDDRYSLKLNVRTQGLFKYEDQEDQKNTASFSVKRARLIAGGSMFYPWMQYYTQLTLEGSNTGLRDAYIEAAYYDWAKPRIGQYKVPFDRQFLTSAFNLELI